MFSPSITASPPVESPRDFSKKEPLIPSTVFATSVLVVTEVMFFMALISAFVIIKSNYAAWAPPKGIILPIATTAFSTGVLFLSGIMLHFVGKSVKNGEDRSRIEARLVATMALGLFFVLVQGYEWFNLMSFGMTMDTSVFGACFFLIIGTHALHAFVAILGMFYVFRIVRAGEIKLEHIHSMQVFWYFVVGIWPILYGLVYF